MNASICWQQSLLMWLLEGDVNSKYFHYVLAGRRRRNVISSLLVNGTLVEGEQPIRVAVYAHFSNHFQSVEVVRPGVDNLVFRRLNLDDGVGFVRPFNVEEVKAAVWDCDSYKSLGPENINFGFIKEFWSELKEDIMTFINEFHKNGK